MIYIPFFWRLFKTQKTIDHDQPGVFGAFSEERVCGATKTANQPPAVACGSSTTSLPSSRTRTVFCRDGPPTLALEATLAAPTTKPCKKIRPDLGLHIVVRY